MNSTETTEVIQTEASGDAEMIAGSGESPEQHDERPLEQSSESALAEDHSHHHHEPAAPTLNPELTREIEVEVPADEVSKTYRTVTKRYQKLARIPGFRAGKVPESLIRSKFAKELREEVLEALVSPRFREALQERKLNPVSEPQLLDLQLFDGQPLRFKAAFEVLPEFDVAGYDSVHMDKPQTDLTEDEFDAEVQHMMESRATVEPVEEERPLGVGDWAEIEFRGEVKPLAQVVTEDGVTDTAPEPPIVGEDVMIEIGGKQTLPAFNEALTGASVGQELKFEVEYPADFGQRKLAGQTVSYDVKVKAIKKKTYPERDAELARQFGDFETWQDFEDNLRVRTNSQKRESIENGARNQLLDQIVARFRFPVPESFVQQQVDARLERGLRALAQQGMKSEDMRKLDFPRLRAAQRTDAEREVRASLVLDKIADAEGVSIADTELDNELLMMSIQTREPLETLRERLAQDGGLNRIREQMRREKTGRVLYEKLVG